MSIALNSPEFIADPYAFYDALRSRGDILWDTDVAAWLVSGHESAAALLQDRRLSCEVTAYRRVLPRKTSATERDRIQHFFSQWLLYIDPPKHTAMRRALSPFFSRAAIDAHAINIQHILENLLSVLPAQFDYVSSVAHYLSPMSMAVYLGLPTDEPEQYLRWSFAITRFVETVFTLPNTLYGFLETLDEMQQFFNEFLVNAAHDSVAKLMGNALVKENIVSAEEVWMVLGMVLVAGIETSTGQLTTCLYHALKNPSLYQQLVEDEKRIETAVDELIRYDSVAQVVCRIAAEPLSYLGHDVDVGQLLYIFVGAANRDPNVYEAPYEIRFDRDNPPHLSFSTGIHYCLGRLLGRLLVQMQFNVLTKQLPNLSLGEFEPEWVMIRILRHLKACPVRSA